MQSATHPESIGGGKRVAYSRTVERAMFAREHVYVRNTGRTRNLCYQLNDTDLQLSYFSRSSIRF